MNDPDGRQRVWVLMICVDGQPEALAVWDHPAPAKEAWLRTSREHSSAVVESLRVIPGAAA